MKKTKCLFHCLVLSWFAFVLNSSTYARQCISETVTYKTSNQLTGVTILMKGTTIGTLTDASGKYIIVNARENKTLNSYLQEWRCRKLHQTGRWQLMLDL